MLAVLLNTCPALNVVPLRQRYLYSAGIIRAARPSDVYLHKSGAYLRALRVLPLYHAGDYPALIRQAKMTDIFHAKTPTANKWPLLL